MITTATLTTRPTTTRTIKTTTTTTSTFLGCDSIELNLVLVQIQKSHFITNLI